MDDGQESYIHVGTPLEDESEATLKSSAKDPSLLRSLPVHKQEALDEQGRRRFHGAFTGGFSAGYYNTVGSKARCETG
jgi:G patch domain-containing protein 1